MIELIQHIFNGLIMERVLRSTAYRSRAASLV
jgi:hypothetical protein